MNEIALLNAAGDVLSVVLADPEDTELCDAIAAGHPDCDSWMPVEDGAVAPGFTWDGNVFTAPPPPPIVEDPPAGP